MRRVLPSQHTHTCAKQLHRQCMQPKQNYKQMFQLRSHKLLAACCSGSKHAFQRRTTTAAVAPDRTVDSSKTQEPAAPRRKRVLSGVQPTGTLHLGNYFGAIRNWVNLQDLYDTYFMMADLHAITVPHEPKELLSSTRNTAALYLACGIDPERSAVFVQSHVTAHAELAWLLQCYTPIGWLRKMIQFKTKSEKQGEEVGAGLLTYPALMAADILLYQADLVPVGEDQKQHLELTRDLATRFNNKFGGRNWKKMGGRKGQLFTVPEPFIPPTGARVMSLTDGTQKMSKSAESDMSRINLLDEPSLLVKKIKSAKTDSGEGLEWDDPNRPEARNLISMYTLATGMSLEAATRELSDMRWGDFKPLLADAMVEHLAPIRTNYALLMKDTSYLDGVLAQGASRADELASVTVANVKQAMGFLPK